MKRLYLRLYGIVQGVGCRYFVRRLATQMGVKGYVKNIYDGSVEIRVEGEDDSVDLFVQAVREGPPAGRVDEIQINDEKPTGEFDSFVIDF